MSERKVEAPEWIYAPGMLKDREKFYESIEKALGFKLFIWQKTFIEMGYYRRSGETTAYILRELLQVKERPLDFTKPAKTNRERCYRQQFKEIYQKLKAAGVKTRKVFWSMEDKRGYTSNRRLCENPDCERCPFPKCSEEFIIKSKEEAERRKEKRQWIR